jgi:hypothetical protein
MLCDMMYLKSILLYILSLFFTYLLLRFIFSHKEGLTDEEKANYFADNEATSAEKIKGVISSESKLAEQTVTERLQEFAKKLDGIVYEQKNHNNSDGDKQKEADASDAAKKSIENNPYTPISSVGTSVFIKGAEKEKYYKIVVKHMS